MFSAIKLPCRCATTANITLSGLQTIDGVTVVSGDRVLVRSQLNAVQNGIYVVSTGAWTRSLDFNDDVEITTGTVVWVYSGSTYFGWHDITTAHPSIGVTEINWRLSVMQLTSAIMGAAGNSLATSGADAQGISYCTGAFLSTGSSSASFEGRSGSYLYSSGLSDSVGDGSSNASVDGLSSGSGVAIAFQNDPAMINSVWMLSMHYTQRYSLDSGTVTLNTTITGGQFGHWSAVGKGEYMIVHGDLNRNTQALKYTYASETTSNSANLTSSALSYRAGMQTDSTGYFSGGLAAGGLFGVVSTKVDKITFSTDASSTGTSLLAAKYSHAAQGNVTRGIIVHGRFSAPSSVATGVSKYTYASDTVVAGTTYTPGKYLLGAIGNTTIAVFSGGYDGTFVPTKTSKKYTYSSDAVTTTTSLAQDRYSVSGAGTNSTGIFCGHTTTGGLENTTEIYTFGSDTVTAGTSLFFAEDGFAMKAVAIGGLVSF